MEHVEVVERTRALCSRVLTVPADEIVPEARLVADLEADSLDFAELEDSIGTAFGISVAVGELRTVETFGDLTELVFRSLGQAAASGSMA